MPYARAYTPTNQSSFREAFMKAGVVRAIRLVLAAVFVLGLGEARCEETGVRRQPVSKWIVDLKAPLRNAYEETNERGQVLQLGEREISFRLTSPADSVMVEVLFVNYAGSGGPTYVRWPLGPDGIPWHAKKQKCSETIGIPIWRTMFREVQPESLVTLTWDHVWDENTIEEWEVGSWGSEAYDGGLEEADPAKLVCVGREKQIAHYPLTCREWLPDPYHPVEIWGTWRHDERGRVVRGSYHIGVETWAGAEHESTTSSGIILFAEDDTIQPADVLETAAKGAEKAFWGWYCIPGGHWEAAFEETQWFEEQKRK
jgi:hypothetical protein